MKGHEAPPCPNCGHPKWVNTGWFKVWTHRLFYGRCVYEGDCRCERDLNYAWFGWRWML